MKNVIITGANSGFGKLTAEKLASEGFKVFATMRGKDSKNKAAAKTLKDWALSKGFALEIVELDVTDNNSVSNAINFIAKQCNGKIDVLVNNAGINSMGVNEAFTDKNVEDIFQINVFGSHRLIKSVLPFMRKQSEGLIIQISSVVAKNPLPYAGVYSSSKAAIDALALTYAYELRPLGIDVVILQPGAFPTEIVAKSLQPTDGAVFAEYGETALMLPGFMKTFGEMMQPDVAGNPQEIADTIFDVVKTPNGKRKTWKVIDKFYDATEKIGKINSTVSEVGKGFLTTTGLNKMLNTNN